MTVTESINRGYNLLVTTVLFFGGLAFGTVGFAETDLPDKIDDFGLLAVGLIAVAWYLMADHRLQRSVLPLALAVAAVVLQLVAVPLESDDTTAFGDNIGGLVLLVPFVIFAAIQYSRTARLLKLA